MNPQRLTNGVCLHKSDSMYSGTDKMGFCRQCHEYVGIIGDTITDNSEHLNARKFVIGQQSRLKYISKKYGID